MTKLAPRVVVTVHGIRTYGGWQMRLENLLSGDSRWRRALDEDKIFHYKYGFLSILTLCIPFLRHRTVRQFERYLASLHESMPDARIDIVAHSFGTYLTLKALTSSELPPSLQINSLVFCGAAISPHEDLSSLVGKGRRVSRLVNECGINDQILFLTLVLGDLGMAGRIGLQGLEGYTAYNRYHTLGHSGFFQNRAGLPVDGFMRRWWLPLLLSAESRLKPRDRRPPGPPLKDRIVRVFGENGAIITVSIYAMFACVVGLGGVHYWQQRAERMSAIENNIVEMAKVLASKSREKSAIRDYGSALRLALDALAVGPESATKIIPEVIQAMSEADSNIRELAVLTHGENKWIEKAFFTTDERYIITQTLSELHVWDGATKKHIQTFACPCAMSSAPFSKDGKMLLVWERETTAIRIYMIGDSGIVLARKLELKPIRTESAHGNNVTYAEFDDNGLRVVSSHWNGQVFLWSVSKNSPIRELEGHGNKVVAIYASFVAGGDILTLTDKGVIRIFDLAKVSLPKVSQLPNCAEVFSFSLSRLARWTIPSDEFGARIAVRCPSRTLLVSKPYGRVTATIGEVDNSTALVAGRLFIPLTYNQIGVYDSDGRQVRKLSGHRDSITSVTARDRRPSTSRADFFASSSRDATVILWKTSSPEIISTLVGHSGVIHSVSIAPRSDRVLTAGDDGTARLWRAGIGGTRSEVGLVRTQVEIDALIAHSRSLVPITTDSGPVRH